MMAMKFCSRKPSRKGAEVVLGRSFMRQAAGAPISISNRTAPGHDRLITKGVEKGSMGGLPGYIVRPLQRVDGARESPP